MQRASAILGHRSIGFVARRLTQRSLRIVAYHDVPDADAFRSQLVAFKRHYRMVDEATVVEAAVTGRPLEPRSAWITFDDGHPTVVERAQPVLDELGIRATVYVCPGLIDTEIPQWTNVIREAQRRGLGPSAPVVEIKRSPDDERRRLVADAAEQLAEQLGQPLTSPQLTTDALKSWRAAGHSVGNHTWDHPCLDMCSTEEQDRQIKLAHDWLVDELEIAQPTFAYPNGNWSGAAEASLRSLGYPLALLFDHRLTDLSIDALRLSRLRLSADADVDRAEAIMSGAHPALFGLSNMVRKIWT